MNRPIILLIVLLSIVTIVFGMLLFLFFTSIGKNTTTPQAPSPTPLSQTPPESLFPTPTILPSPATVPNFAVTATSPAENTAVEYLPVKAFVFTFNAVPDPANIVVQTQPETNVNIRYQDGDN